MTVLTMGASPYGSETVATEWNMNCILNWLRTFDK